MPQLEEKGQLPPPNVWRGWFTSQRRRSPALPALSGQRMESRLFPKTRSWLAEGAPLELMSPLSVLRLLFGLGTLLLGIEGAVLDWPPGALPFLLSAPLAAGAVFVALGVIRTVTQRCCTILALIGVAIILLEVSAGRSAATVVAPVILLVPFAAFVALYLGFKVVTGFQLVVFAALSAALSPACGIGYGILVALIGVLAMFGVAGAVRVLIGSVWRSGSVDPETGLPNAVGLAERLATSAGQAPSPYCIATVVLGGVDDARQALGYWAGSELMLRAVDDLSQILPPGAWLSRVEGDELVVAYELKGVAPRAEWPTSGGVPGPLVAAGRALSRVISATVDAGQHVVEDVEVSLRGHVGMAFSPWQGSDPTELARRASLAAHEAEATGRLEAVWSGERGTFSAEDLALLADMRSAADRGQFHLVYQPQVESTTGLPVAAEALLRWESPVHGTVPTARFIALAERTGLVDRLTNWVLQEALDAQERWRSVGIELPVAVNVSAKTLVGPELSDWLLGELSRRDIPAENLIVEVTETAAGDRRLALELLSPLHDQGVQVAIDDFGTGFTSLAAIPHLPLDQIKVDMAFVKASLTSAPDEAIVRSVRDLVHRLGLVSVAEGVETAPLREFMTEIGFDLLQGYHLAYPLSEADLLDFVRQSGAAAAARESARAAHPGARAADPSPMPSDGQVVRRLNWGRRASDGPRSDEPDPGPPRQLS